MMEESSKDKCSTATTLKLERQEILSPLSTKIERTSSSTMAQRQTSVMSGEYGISTSERTMIEQPCKVEELPSRSNSVKDLPSVTVDGNSLPKRIKIEESENIAGKSGVSIQKNEAPTSSATAAATLTKPQQSEIVESKIQDTTVSNGPVTQSLPQSGPVKSETVAMASHNNAASESTNQTTTNVSNTTSQATPSTATVSATSQSPPAATAVTVPATHLGQTSSKPGAAVAPAPVRQHRIEQQNSTSQTASSTPAATVSQTQSSSSDGSAPSTKPAPVAPLSTPPSHPAAPAAVSTTSTVPRPTANSATTSATPLPAPAPAVPVHPPPSSPPPLKATRMSHLQKKYTSELQYMLREFRKLERQLLGAKGNGTGIEESAGSRERREKLHSFILHLEDTIRQIDLGCKLESEGKSTVMVGVSNGAAGTTSADASGPTAATATQSSEEELKKKQHLADSAALTKLTKEKEEEENVQKLEEHILANLLPVKVRLTKQLAAQQGASRNPAGMPAAPRGMLQPAAEKGKGTFAAAAEQRRKQAEAARVAQQEQSMLATSSATATASPATQTGASTQFGKPLGVGGSSLTQKLHGSTLGSKKRPHGHGVGSPSPVVPISATTAAVNTAVETTTSGEPSCTAHKRKILYAGMAPGSEQIQSSVSAATGVHGAMVIETTPTAIVAVAAAARQSSSESPVAVVKQTPDVSTTSTSQQVGALTVTAEVPQQKATPHVKHATSQPSKPTIVLPSTVKLKPTPALTAAPASVDTSKKSGKRRLEEMNLTEEERKKHKRRRRRRKKRREARRMDMERQRQMVIQQQAVQASQGSASKQSGQTAVPVCGVTGATATTATSKKAGKGSAANKANGKKKGPRAVEYICALCSETYSSTCDYNPWWGLTSHECPKCRKSQIPRIDITAPANAIEYHPALLAHAEDSSGGNTGGGTGAINAGGGMSVMHINPSHMAPNFPIDSGLSNNKYPRCGSDSDTGSDLSDCSDLSDDSYDSYDSETDLQSMTPAEQAENEKFGREYTGPKMTDSECSRLLALMCHASTCPGRHKNPKHRDVCHSTKFLMLHVRDCPGTTSSLDVCPFPWCRKVKHMLYHLVSCTHPKECPICTPKDMSSNLAALMGLNEHRRKKQKERIKAALAAATAAKAKSHPPKTAITIMNTAKSRPMHQLKPTAVNTIKPPQQVRRSVPPTTANSAVAPVTKSDVHLRTITQATTAVPLQQPIPASQPKVATAVTSKPTPPSSSNALPAAGALSSVPTAQPRLVVQGPKATPAPTSALPVSAVGTNIKVESSSIPAIPHATAVNVVEATSSTTFQAPVPLFTDSQRKVEASSPLGTADTTCTPLPSSAPTTITSITERPPLQPKAMVKTQVVAAPPTIVTASAQEASVVSQTSQPQQQITSINTVSNPKVEAPSNLALSTQAMTSTTKQDTTSVTIAPPAPVPAASSSANTSQPATDDPVRSTVADKEAPTASTDTNPSTASVSVSTPTTQPVAQSVNLLTELQEPSNESEENPPLSPARIDSEELLPPPVSDSISLNSHTSPSQSDGQSQIKSATTKPVLVPAVTTTATEKEVKEVALTRTTNSAAALIEDSEGCCGRSETENDAASRCTQNGDVLQNGSTDTIATAAAGLKPSTVNQVSTNASGGVVGGVTAATGDGEKDGSKPFDNNSTSEGQRQTTSSAANPTEKKTSCSEQVVKKEEPVRISC